MSQKLYELKAVSYSYRWQNQKISVLKNVDLTLESGSFTCLVGPSGSGKTTLLNLLGFLDVPNNGDFFYRTHDRMEMSETALENIRLKEVGFVFQAFSLIPTLTALENTAYFLPQLGYSKKDAKERGELILEQVGLIDQRKKYPSELSGGQRQRVAIARALAKKPQIILADEPTANLDPKTAEELTQIFHQLQKQQGVTLIFSTHDVKLSQQADDILEIREGKVLRQEKSK